MFDIYILNSIYKIKNSFKFEWYTNGILNYELFNNRMYVYIKNNKELLIYESSQYTQLDLGDIQLYETLLEPENIYSFKNKKITKIVDNLKIIGN